MNLISGFEAHKRDEDFDREDAKHRAPVTHTQRVAFADAMMKEPEPERCEECGGTFDCDDATCVCRWDGKP